MIINERITIKMNTFEKNTSSINLVFSESLKINDLFENVFNKLELFHVSTSIYSSQFVNQKFKFHFQYESRYNRQFDGLMIELISKKLKFNINYLIEFIQSKESDSIIELKYKTLKEYKEIIDRWLIPHFLNYDNISEEFEEFLQKNNDW